MSTDRQDDARISFDGPFNCPTCGAHDFGLHGPPCRWCQQKEIADLRRQLAEAQERCEQLRTLKVYSTSKCDLHRGWSWQTTICHGPHHMVTVCPHCERAALDAVQQETPK